MKTAKMKKEDVVHTIVVIVIAIVAVLIMLSTINTLSGNELLGKAFSPIKAKLDQSKLDQSKLAQPKSEQSYKSGELPYTLKFPVKIMEIVFPPKRLCCHSYVKKTYTYECSGRFEWGSFIRVNTSNEKYQQFLNDYGSYGFNIGINTVAKFAEDELISEYLSDSCNVLLNKLEEGVTQQVGEDLPPEAKQALEEACNGELERTASVSFFTREVDKALCESN